MSTKYYGSQYDDSSSNNARSLRRNYATINSTPGYHSGAPLDPLAYTRFVEEFQALPGTKVYWYGGEPYGPYPQPAPHLSEVMDSALLTNLLANNRNSAIANLNGRMRGSQFSLGVTMVEGRKTVNMIGDISRRLLGAYRNVRRGKFSEAADLLLMDPPSHRRQKSMKREALRGAQGLSKNWLMYRYGIRPLIQDVYNGIDAYSTIASSRSDDIIYTGFSRSNDSSNGYNGSSNASILHAITIKAKVQNDDVRNMSALGLDNPALIAWELVPFSFMFDWFLPVGTWLEAMKTPSGFTFTNGCEGVLTKQSAAFKLPSGFISGDINRGWELTTGSAGEYKKEHFDRKIITAFPTPSSLPTTKSLSKALSLPKVIDVVSILTNLSTNRR